MSRLGLPPPPGNDYSAAGKLRNLNIVANQYAQSYGAFPPTLRVLGPPEPTPGGWTPPPSCQGADLIDGVLAAGNKSGYHFEYRAGPVKKDPNPKPYVGCPAGVESYTLTARPVEFGVNGTRSYFTDQTGVVRFTNEIRPATAADPPLI